MLLPNRRGDRSTVERYTTTDVSVNQTFDQKTIFVLIPRTASPIAQVEKIKNTWDSILLLLLLSLTPTLPPIKIHPAAYVQPVRRVHYRRRRSRHYNTRLI